MSEVMRAACLGDGRGASAINGTIARSGSHVWWGLVRWARRPPRVHIRVARDQRRPCLSASQPKARLRLHQTFDGRGVPRARHAHQECTTTHPSGRLSRRWWLSLRLEWDVRNPRSSLGHRFPRRCSKRYTARSTVEPAQGKDDPQRRTHGEALMRGMERNV